MEFILNIRKDGQDNLVQCVQSIFGDERRARQVLLHIKDIRNSSAHGGKMKNDEPYTTIFLAEIMISEVISFIFAKKTIFREKSDISTFFQIQSDPTQRANELRLRQEYEKIDKRKL